MKNDMSKQGYNQEEEYFYRKNQELIDQRRKELDRDKAGRKSQPSHAHWMRCPKCGEEMAEIDMSGIKVDQCTECQGIYFDAGELQTLVSSQEPKSFLGMIRKRMS